MSKRDRQETENDGGGGDLVVRGKGFRNEKKKEIGMGLIGCKKMHFNFTSSSTVKGSIAVTHYLSALHIAK